MSMKTKKQNMCAASEMPRRYSEVFNFLKFGTFPDGFSKTKRLTLRRYAEKFALQGDELFYGGNRRVISTVEQAKELFKDYHCTPSGGHTGIVRTKKAFTARYYWHGMSKIIEDWISKCDKCQRTGKPIGDVKPLTSIKVTEVWELLGIDLVGPLPKTPRGYIYVLTITDHYSKWVEAFPLKTKTALEVTEKLCSLMYRHGCPKRILSDQGREFVNEINLNLCKALQIERSITAAYHPQTNGLAERTNGNIKRVLSKFVNDEQTDWDQYLEPALFSIRSKIHTGTKFTPFYLMYGREARFLSEVPIDFPLSSIILSHQEEYATKNKLRVEQQDQINKTVKENMGKSQEKQQRSYMKKQLKKYRNINYQIGDQVLLYNMRRKGRKGGRLERDFTGPYIIQTISRKSVILSTKDGKIKKQAVSMSHLKPYKQGSVDIQPVMSDQEDNIKESLQNNQSIELLPSSHENVEQEAKCVLATDQLVSNVSSIRDTHFNQTINQICTFNSGNVENQSVLSSNVECDAYEDKMDIQNALDEPVDLSLKTTFPCCTVPTNTSDVKVNAGMESSNSSNGLVEDEVLKIWAQQDCGRIEAVIREYRLYDTSFRTLQGKNWLNDDIIDAYLSAIIKPDEVHLVSSVVATALYNGHFLTLGEKKFPKQWTWLCPINTGNHWILMIAQFYSNTVVLIDPLGHEDKYESKLTRNWRNFLRVRRKYNPLQKWKNIVPKHQLQMDGHSCGVLVLKFAEEYLTTASVCNVSTHSEDVARYRHEIAATLLANKGNADDFCVDCNMLETGNGQNDIKMVQCDCCARWTHQECVPKNTTLTELFLCKKCASSMHN